MLSGQPANSGGLEAVSEGARSLPACKTGMTRFCSWLRPPAVTAVDRMARNGATLARLHLLVAIAVMLFAPWSAPALGHAALVESVPADGAVLSDAPRRLALTFNEPVAPRALSLITADQNARALDHYHLEGTTVVIDPPANLARGSYALSWRVVSEDGHPVGGSVVFSVGTPGATGTLTGEPVVDWPLRAAIWTARITIYVALFLGVGGFAFHAFSLPLPFSAGVKVVLLLGLFAVPFSAGLQGLDVLGLSFPEVARPDVWTTGIETFHGIAAIIAALATAAALAGLYMASGRRKKALAFAALSGVGLAFAASGHASTAAPELLTRPAVFVHATAVAWWTGALTPLALALRGGHEGATAALLRFSRAIPVALVPLVVTGVALGVVQVEGLSALWSTAYGQAFLVKLALVAALLGTAAFNRWRLTGPAAAGVRPALGTLIRSITIEIVLVMAILGVVATWRFTPPPRALAAASMGPAVAHLDGGGAMADLVLAPGRVGPAIATIVITTEASQPLAAQEVTLLMSHVGAGIESIRRDATRSDEGIWRVDDLLVPAPGSWRVRLRILVSDFVRTDLEGLIDVRP